MRGKRWLLAAALAAAAGCARSNSDEGRAGAIDARREHAPRAPATVCEMIVNKLRTCRDSVLMAARTGMVASGETPEDAVTMSVEISEGFERKTSDICAVYPESDLIRGTRCFPVKPCDAFAACMIDGVQPAPAATGPNVPACPDQSSAVQVERRGKTTQWCVRADGLPNGPYVVRDGATVEVEGAYAMGVPHGRWIDHRGATPHVRVYEEGVVVEMDGQRLVR